MRKRIDWVVEISKGHDLRRRTSFVQGLGHTFWHNTGSRYDDASREISEIKCQRTRVLPGSIRDLIAKKKSQPPGVTLRGARPHH